ncbi:MAG TPA: LacI family DNA-binding transcriptional regulator [Dermatophilaceae bacterium]|nr:LacI family DNA-binding transcriptional regulator [Dermatophilaceae bacterium]
MTTLSSTRSARPTMVDVAREAQVSLKTVSRVVNREPGVRPETSERVRAVMERLGFQRNDSARQLRRGKTASIGLVVEDLANPFYSSLAAAIEQEAREASHLLISGSTEGSVEREASLVDALLDRRVDGLVVVPATGSVPETAERRTWGTPLVYVDRPVEGASADTVLSDNDGGIRSAVEHLAGHGHRGLGYLGDAPDLWTARRREAAFRTACADLALPVPPRVAMGPHTAGSLVPVLKEWGRGAEPATALVTGNNRVTVALLHALQASGLRFSFVGYDDFELADVLVPPVTVVHQDPPELGRRAARRLFGRLGGDASPPHTERVPTRLIVRESGAMAASGRS